MAKTSDKILIGVFVVAIVLAAVIVIYTRFTDNGDEDKEETMLTVLYEGKTWEYTMSDLEKIDDYNGSGGMKKESGIAAPNEYKGVRFELLLKKINSSTDVSLIRATFKAADINKMCNLSSEELQGNVTIYDETDNETNGIVTLIIAYEKDGVPLTIEDGGPLRLVFVSEQPLFTRSSYWVKQLTTIEVFPASL